METPLLIGSGHVSRRTPRRETAPGSAFAGMRELACLCLLLLALNLPVFFGGANPFAYDVHAVGAGQWWRALTHPFTHVSPYHFFLDGVAFVALWAGLAGTVWRRVALTTASAAGALLLSLAVSPQIREVGLSGLSGVAHGLLVAAAADAVLRLPRRDGMCVVSLITLATVCGKAAYELFTGDLAFGFMHRGPLGTPIVECHAGGVAGAAIFVLIERGLSAVRLLGKNQRP
jgi:rhomboid family GlyGly-CTERM serine protease